MNKYSILSILISAHAVSAADPNQQILQPQAAQRIQVQNAWNGQANQLMQIRNVQNFQGRQNARPLNAPANSTALLSAAEVRKSVDRAIAYIQRNQQEDGSIAGQYGQTVMAALAMLGAGADPVSDTSLARALGWLQENDVDNTYYRGIRANVWQYCLRRSPDDPTFRKALKDDYAWLIKALGKKEGWRYRMDSRDWDNSVTQYGVLGVWAACRAGVDPGDAFWEKMSKHFLDCQNPDGGWGYEQGGSSANMATAGLATMFLVFDMYHGRQYYQADKGNPFTKGKAAKCLLAIDRGMGWLDENGGRNNDGYYLYGIERTGVASGRRRIGGHDWFKEGAAAVLCAQQPDGLIPMGGHGGPLVNTAFATLFMVYGGAPIAFNKLEYGTGLDWNLNPRDVANMTKHLGAAYEQPLNWFTVNINAPVEEFEAPILFISGAQSVSFSDEQVDKLRQYVEQGGMILAEPSDNSPEFKQSMAELCQKLYPAEQFPDRALRGLTPNHPVYTVINRDWSNPPKLQAAHLGSRAFFVLSDSYLSKDWQMNATDSNAFKLAMNLLFYTTDRGSLHARFHSHLPNTVPAQATARKLNIGRISATSANPATIRQLSPLYAHTHGTSLHDAGIIDPAVAEPSELPVVIFAPSTPSRPDAATTKAIQTYIEKGGTLLIDAGTLSAQSTDTLRAWAEAEFGKLAPLPRSHPLTVGRMPGGFDLTQGVRFTLPARRSLRAESRETATHHLETINIKGRSAILFTRFGITGPVAGERSLNAAAYRPASARKLLCNILAYIDETRG